MRARCGQQPLHLPGTVVVLTRNAHLGKARKERSERDVFPSIFRRQAHLEPSDVTEGNGAGAQRLEQCTLDTRVIRHARQSTRVGELSGVDARHDLEWSHPRAHCAGPRR